MKEFVTAVNAVEDETEDKAGWIEFKVDGVACRAKRPSPGQVAYVTAATHKRAPIERQVAGLIDFCMGVMDSDTATYLADKLMDNEDPFELDEIRAIVEWLFEEWAGRPTEVSSDSSKSEGTSGPGSTPSSAALAGATS